MTKKILTDIKLGDTWNTYMGSVYAALTKSGVWQGSMSSLMGMTGMAFHFIIHKQTCPSSVTVYEWVQEHLEMMDRIGIYSEITCIMNYQKPNTFPLIHKDVVNKVKESINNNIPVIAWAPTDFLEFGLISGYDDDDQVFHVTVCHTETPDPLLYDNLGKSQIPILYLDFIRGKVEVDKEKIYYDSLQFGLAQWEKSFHSTPDYASGYNAYNNLIHALENNDFQIFGLTYILSSYCDSKEMILAYLKEIKKESKTIKQLEPVIEQYEQVVKGFQTLTELIPFQGMDTKSIDENTIKQALPLIKELQEMENKAMNELKKILE